MRYNNKVLLGLLLAVGLLVGFGLHSYAQATYKASTVETNNLEAVDTTPDFVAVEMLSNSSGWAVGSTGEFYSLSSTQNNISVWDFKQALGEDIQVTDISFVSPSSGWAVGAKPASGTETNGAVWHYDGTSWQQTPSATMGILYGIDMLSDWEGWAVGEMRVLRYISFTWTIDDLITPYGPIDVDAVSSNNVWVTGWPGVYHNNGSGWQPTQPTSWSGGGPTSIDMLSASSGWAVRYYGGKIYRYNGTNWLEVASPTANSLSDIHMVSANEGWAVGDQGTILHYNGSNWQAAASPTTENLNAIFMWSNTRGTAVGDNGTILGYNNGIWSTDSLRIPPTCAGLSFYGNPLNGGNYSTSPEPDCPDNNFKYKSDTVITLTALPALGYKFASWSGAITSTENPTTITLGDSDRSIIINFDQVPCYTINYGSNNPLWGSVRIDWSENKTQQKYLCPPGLDESRWQASSRVWLNAVPNTGYRLKTWQGMDTLPNPENVTPVYIDMYKDRTIAAIFEENYKIYGYISNKSDSSEIANALVRLTDNLGNSLASPVNTNDDGYYELTNLHKGTYYLSVVHDNFFAEVRGPITLPPSTREDFQLDSALIEPDQAVVDAVNNLALNATNNLANLRANNAEKIAKAGDYFTEKKVADQIERSVDLAFDLIFNVLHTYKNLPSSQIKKHAADAVTKHVPGYRYSIDYLLDKKQAQIWAKATFDESIRQSVNNMDPSRVSLVILQSGLDAYLKDLKEEVAIEITKQAFLSATSYLVEKYGNKWFTSGLFPIFSSFVDGYTTDINARKSSIISEIPELSTEEVDLYIEDFKLRQQANSQIYKINLRNSSILRFAHDESVIADSKFFWEEAWVEYFGDMGISIMAGIGFDGPGLLVAGGYQLLKNWYFNTEDIKMDDEMIRMATLGMGGVVESSRQIYFNTISGYEILANPEVTPEIAKGVISYCNDFLFSTYVGQLTGDFHFLDSAYTRVVIVNPTEYEIIYEISGLYQESSFLDTKAAFLSINDIVVIPAGQQQSIKLYYMDEGKGSSPDPNSSVEIEVIGTTKTGSYYVDSKILNWGPNSPNNCEQIRSFQQAPTVERSGDIKFYDIPIIANNYSSKTENTHILTLWTRNPLESTIHGVLNQIIPDGITVIDSAGATISGETLSWNVSLRPNEYKLHRLILSKTSTQDILLPKATLSLEGEQFNGVVEFSANEQLIKEQFPLTISEYKITESTLSVIVKNRNQGLTSGIIKWVLFEDDGDLLNSKTEPVSLDAGSNISLSLNLSDLSEGVYFVTLDITVGSETDKALRLNLEISSRTTNNVYLPLINK